MGNRHWNEWNREDFALCKYCTRHLSVRVVNARNRWKKKLRVKKRRQQEKDLLRQQLKTFQTVASGILNPESFDTYIVEDVFYDSSVVPCSENKASIINQARFMAEEFDKSMPPSSYLLLAQREMNTTWDR